MQGVIVDSVLDGLRFVRVYITDQNQSPDLGALAAEFDYVFAYSLEDLGEVDGFSSTKKWTQLIDLNGKQDEIFGHLSKNNRYKVNRSYRDEGVSVVVGDLARERSLAFYREIKQADGVAPDVSQDFDTVLWINAYQYDQLISSTCWFDSGDVLRAKHIVSTRKQEGVDSALVGRLTRRLFWEACEFGLAHRYRYVDLGGVDRDEPAKQGVRAFKQSFGGATLPVFIYRYTTARWRELAVDVRQRGIVIV